MLRTKKVKISQCNPARLVSVDHVFALVTVTCEEEHHRIAVTNKGSLSFFDHDRSLGLEDFGLREAGEPSKHECGRIYRLWQEGRTYNLPDGLTEAYGQLAEAKKSEREKRRCHRHNDRPSGRKERLVQDAESAACAACRGGDDLLVEARDRYHARVRRTADECLQISQAYRTGHRHNWHARVGPKPSIESDMEREWDRYDEKSYPITSITATVTLSWLRKVHARGFTHVGGGHFVLDVLSERPDGKLVLLVGKQSRGYGVTPAGATYDPATDKLRFL
jgi:hypothetical protein